MTRRLLSLATLLSLILSLTAAVMWVRGLYVVEGWDSTPHPSGLIYLGQGYYQQWGVESSNGRLAWVNFRFLVRPSPRSLPPGSPHMAGVIPPTPPTGGYYATNVSEAVSPSRHSRRYPAVTLARVQSHGSIPGVAE